MNTRRKLLKALGLVPVMISLASPLQAATAAFTRLDLGNGLTLLQGAGTNVVVAESTDGVVIVNGGSQDKAEALLTEIKKLTHNKPVKALFNTNWRPEHLGLNYLLGASGTPIYAHENTRLWQNADFYVDWADTQHKPMPKPAQANKSFYQSGTMKFGDDTIEYGIVSQANTDGDIYVRFTKADVLVVGDMLNPDSYLLLDYVTGGWINGAQKTTAKLLELCSDKTKVVAANGGVLGKPALQEQAAMLTVAYDAVAKAFQGGRSLEEFKQADPMKDYRARYGSPDLFLALLYRGTWYHVPGRAVRNVV
jgi:glyoxylase-like metal-dependent hydrolase (beta-lactamase superfamily II)